MSKGLLVGFDSLDYWRLCDSLSIVQAALLTVGEDPGTENVYVERWDAHNIPKGYEAAKTAITNALKKGFISGEVIPDKETDCNGNTFVIEGTVNLYASSVDVDSLKDWLRSRGFATGFFFPEPLEATDYLDPNHPRYAPKLVAAIRAWEATAETNGKSPKQSLMIWLRTNASEYGLINDEGNPIESAVDDIAKVANWQQEGGAPRTPVKTQG